MKAYEAAKELGKNTKEFCEEHDLSSHLCVLSDELVDKLFPEEPAEAIEVTETIDTTETLVVEAEVVEATSVADDGSMKEQEPECPYTAEEIELSIRCLGAKSKLWKWKHVLNG